MIEVIWSVCLCRSPVFFDNYDQWSFKCMACDCRHRTDIKHRKREKDAHTCTSNDSINQHKTSMKSTYTRCEASKRERETKKECKNGNSMPNIRQFEINNIKKCSVQRSMLDCDFGPMAPHRLRWGNTQSQVILKSKGRRIFSLIELLEWTAVEWIPSSTTQISMLLPFELSLSFSLLVCCFFFGFCLSSLVDW